MQLLENTSQFIPYFGQQELKKIELSIFDPVIGGRSEKNSLKTHRMIRMNFHTEVNSPISKVYDFMLGISDKSTYESWTAIFNPTSTFEGDWSQGSKILFVGTGENGEKGGMVSRILENKPNEFLSIQHYGMLKDGVEITEGPEVESWAGGLENYLFEQMGDKTRITIEIDTLEGYEDYMNKSYPPALQKLKELCEQS